MGKLSVGLLAGVVIGWMAAPGPALVTEYQIVHREVTSVPEPVHEWQPTPYADSLVDWEQQDRDEQCLWDLLQAGGWDITYSNVVTLSDWARMNGGPCRMLEGE